MCLNNWRQTQSLGNPGMHKSLLRWITENTRPNCCKVVIAVFTRCVIEICTRKQYEPNYKYYRFIFYWGDITDTHEAGRYLGSYRYLRLAKEDGSK